jgi:uncharacterized caspase-like protein
LYGKGALLIGSQTYGLIGVENDVQAMAELLEPLKFETTRLLGEGAKRQGILEAYEKLIQDTKTSDAAFIFYSGHGGLADNPNYRTAEAAGRRVPRYYQFIVPTDIDDTNETDFRGITNLELSLLLNRLTQKSQNVT